MLLFPLFFPPPCYGMYETTFFLSNLLNEYCSVFSNPNKENDLFNFYQSKDLSSLSKSCTHPAVETLLSTLNSLRFTEMVSQHTNVPLSNSKIDSISAHIYPPNGFLLCHDDDIKQSSNGNCRRVAFILYLVEEDWSVHDGGALDLYEHKDGAWNIPVSILPQFGLFAMFRVGEDSLHRVAEVTGSRDRVSIRYGVYIP
jgi:Rps23 Pro-64 3,4-dihydroxylase Tpa1-like proline 4-hydroxylase